MQAPENESSPDPRAGARVAELLAELNACRNILRIYPASHPAVQAANTKLLASLSGVLEAGKLLELGFARGKAYANGHEIGAGNPLLRRIAQTFYRQGLTRLSFLPGLGGEELFRFMETIAAVPDEGHTPGELERRTAELGLTHIVVAVTDLSMLSFEGTPAAGGAEEIWERLILGLVNSAASDERAEARLEVGLDSASLALMWQRSDGVSESMIESLLAASEACPHDRRSVAAFTTRLLGLASHLTPADHQRILRALLRGGSRFTEISDRVAVEVPPEHLLAAVRQLDLETDPIPRAVVRRLKYLSTPAEMAGDSAREPRPPTEIEMDEARRLLAILASRKDLEIDASAPERDAIAAAPRRALPPTDPGRLDTFRAYQRELSEDGQHRELTWAIFNLIEAGSRDEVEELALRLVELHDYLLDIGQFEVCHEIYLRTERYATRWPDSRPLERLLASLRGSETVTKVAVALKVWGSENYEAILRLIAAYGTFAVRVLVDMLSIEEDFAVRRKIIEAILRIGGKATPHLLPALGDGRWYVVRNIILLLRELDERTSAPAVRRLWMHEHPKVQIEVVRTLVRFGDSQGMDLLQEGMLSKNAHLAQAAIALAGSIGDERCVGLLASLLQQWNSRLHPTATATIIDGLARTRSSRAVEVLEELAWMHGLRGMFVRRATREAALRALATMPIAPARQSLDRLALCDDAGLASLARSLAEESRESS